MKCINCYNEINEDKYIRKYYSKESKTTYKLYHCHVCDLKFWVPLEFMRNFYEGGLCYIYDVVHKGIIRVRNNHRFFIKFFPNIFNNNPRIRRLIDIGCSNGSFLKEMEKFGLEVYGIDIDKRSVEIARNVFGLKNVYNMDLKEFVNFCDKEKLKFDIVTFFEVLEHQVNPKEFINLSCKLLSDDGIIVGSVPNEKHLISRFFREFQKGDFPPHHFLWFSKNSLTNMFNACGFECNITLIEGMNFYDYYTGAFLFLYAKTGWNFLNIYDKTTSNKNLLYKLLIRTLRFFFSIPISLLSILLSLGSSTLFFVCKMKRTN